jgi:aspartate aminotransferase
MNTQGPPDALFGLIDAYNKDPAPKKISLGIGAYRDDAGKPYVLPSVRVAEEAVLSAHMNHECVIVSILDNAVNLS